VLRRTPVPHCSSEVRGNGPRIGPAKQIAPEAAGTTHNDEVQLCAFDILAEGDDDLRKLPHHLRKASLERLLARRPEGIFVNPFERGEIGPDLFRAACKMGLEGFVSKRRERPYQRASRSTGSRSKIGSTRR